MSQMPPDPARGDRAAGMLRRRVELVRRENARSTGIVHRFLLSRQTIT